MKTIIKSVNSIPLTIQLQIISDYLQGKEPILTKKDTGIKVESGGKRYHVSCQKTKISYIFSIWLAV